MRPKPLTIAVFAALILSLGSQARGGEATADPAGARLGEALVPEGFGATAKGGRGGRVIWVTTLDTEGPGSLTEALDAEGPRIIKFKVAGEIRASDKRNNRVWIGRPHRQAAVKAPGGPANYDSPHSFVTIDGASAPEPGITITNGCLYMGYGVHDVIVRHIRIKTGGVGGAGSWGIICIFGVKRVLIDHCTMTEAADVTLDINQDAQDITAQWCILGPGSKTGHPKKFDHSAGPFVAGGGTRVTLHHNLIPKNKLRNPLLYGDVKSTYENRELPIADVVNNVIFGCHQGALVGAGMRANLVGNFYLRQRAPAIWLVTQYRAQPKVFLKGNISFPDLTAAPGGWMRVTSHPHGRLGPDKNPLLRPGSALVAREPFQVPAVAAQPALEAAKLVLAQAGARPWQRNELETALIAEAQRAAAPVLGKPGK